MALETMPSYQKDQIVYAQGDPADSVRLYEQALKVFGTDDMSMLVISVGAEGPHVNINYAERRAVR